MDDEAGASQVYLNDVFDTEPDTGEIVVDRSSSFNDQETSAKRQNKLQKQAESKKNKRKRRPYKLGGKLCSCSIIKCSIL